MRLILVNTNKNYASSITKKENPSDEDKKWEAITIDEMKKYLAIIIMMGIIRLPAFNMHLQVSIFGKVHL